MSASPAEVLRALAAVLDRLGVGWYVFGAQAVLAWGRPRLTEDVDVTVQRAPSEAGDLAEALCSAGFLLRVPDDPDFVAQTWVLPVEHEATGIPVDIVLGVSGLEAQFLERSRRVELGGVGVPVISPEDLIVAKILSGRPKDVEDVVGILQVQREALDVSQVRRLLGELERALDQADLLPTLEEAISRATRGRR